MNYDPNDLLSQIASQDEAEAAAQRRKSHHSISINVAVLFMKLTFLMDEAKRKNQNIFKMMSIIWSAFMILVYIGGAAMLGLLIYSYATFPDQVKQILVAQGIVSRNYDIDSMSLSKIELKNLADKEGTYTIKRMIIHSTFSDFIRGRVKSVELDGVTMKMAEKKDGIDLGNLPKALLSLNQQSDHQKIKVGNLRLNNATLEFNGLNYKIPVSFQLTGNYTKDSEIAIPLFIREKYVNIDGVLSITGNDKKMDFLLKINNGTLTLPKQSPENITGEIKVATKDMKISQVDTDINLIYGKNSKNTKLSMKKSKGGFSGTLSFDILKGNVAEKGQEFKANLAADFSDVVFDSLYRFHTQEPIKIKINKLEEQGFSLANMNGTLNGKLSCDHLDCVYQVLKNSPLFVKATEFTYGSDTIKSAGEYSLSFVSNKKDTFIYKDGLFSFDLKVNNVSFNGQRNTPTSPVSLSVGNADVIGTYQIVSRMPKMSVDASQISLKTPEISIGEGTFKRDNLFDDNSKIVLTSSKAEIGEKNILGVPFEISVEKQGTATRAVLSVEDVIQISFSGAARLLTGEFSGNIYISEFDLGAIKKPLGEISSLFPMSIADVSGKMAVLGKIHWKNSKQISGPLFVAFKDVGFSVKNSKVLGLNSVLSLQSVQPFVSAPNQKVFIADVKGSVPFQNFMADIKLDNQFLKISSAQLDMAGATLTADTALISLKSDSGLLRLKNSKLDLSQMSPFVKLSGATLSGRGSVDMALEFKNGQFYVRDSELKILGGELDLEKVSQGKIKSYFGGINAFNMRSGTIFIDSNSMSDTVNLNIALDGRIMPTAQTKTVREVIDLNLNEIIMPVRIKNVPEDILKRQQILAK